MPKDIKTIDAQFFCKEVYYLLQKRLIPSLFFCLWFTRPEYLVVSDTRQQNEFWLNNVTFTVANLWTRIMYLQQKQNIRKYIFEFASRPCSIVNQKINTQKIKWVIVKKIFFNTSSFAHCTYGWLYLHCVMKLHFSAWQIWNQHH